MRLPRSSHVPKETIESAARSARPLEPSPAGLPKTGKSLPLLGRENLSNRVPQGALLLFEARTDLTGPR